MTLPTECVTRSLMQLLFLLFVGDAFSQDKLFLFS